MFELAPFALPADYGEGIVPLADVKAHLAIEADETEFDGLLGALRDAGVDMVEKFCGVYLAERTGVVWRAERLPASCWHSARPHLRLGVGPVVELTEGSYLDGSNVSQVWDVTTLRIGVGGAVMLNPGQAWPGDIGGGVAIEFTAGYDDTTRPPALVQAVKLFVAHLFANREAVMVTGQMVAEVPLAFRALCNAYRNVVL